MRLSTVLAPAIAMFTPVLGIITGIAVPDSIAPGSSFRVIIETTNYIQTVQDVAISFGFSPAAGFHSGSLGNFIDSKFLGPDDSNIVTNITHIVNFPASATDGPIVFSGALDSLFGAAFAPTISFFSVNTTVGEFTSGNYVSSHQ